MGDSIIGCLIHQLQVGSHLVSRCSAELSAHHSLIALPHIRTAKTRHILLKCRLQQQPCRLGLPLHCIETRSPALAISALTGACTCKGFGTVHRPACDWARSACFMHAKGQLRAGGRPAIHGHFAELSPFLRPTPVLLPTATSSGVLH